MVRVWQEGTDVVLMRRATRAQESWLKKATANAFYRVIGQLNQIQIPNNVGDYRLLSRRAVVAFRKLPERSRFMKGLFAWIGYPTRELADDRDGRFAGESKWSMRKFLELRAAQGITSFSAAPLKLASYVGFATALVAFSYGVYIIAKTLPLRLRRARLSDAGRGSAVPGRAATDGAGRHRRIHSAQRSPQREQRPLYLWVEQLRAPSRPDRTGRDRGGAPEPGAMALALTVRERRWLAWLVVAIVVVRLVSRADPSTILTEARYGEIARKMLETRQWIMPQFEYGVPFGKPPLSTWLSAAGMVFLGVNEFAARLPSLLLMMGCGALLYFSAPRARPGRRHCGRSRCSPPRD